MTASSPRPTVDTSTHDALRRAAALCGIEGIERAALEELARTWEIDAGAIDHLDLVTAGSRMSLTNVVERENLVASTPDGARAILHRQLATAVRDTSLDLLAGAREQAAHLAAAGDRSAARILLVSAAATARALRDGDSALLVLADAIDLSIDPDTACELRERRAFMATELDAPIARSAWLELVLEHDARGDLEGASRARYFLFWASDDRDAARGVLDEAASHEGSVGWATRASALRCILDERYGDAVDLDRVTLRLARSAGDRRLEALALLGMAAGLSMVGEMRRGIDLQHQAISVADDIGDRRTSALGQLNLGSMLLDDMRPTRALTQADALLAWIDRCGADAWRSEAHALRSAALTQLGRIDEANAAIAAALSCADDAHPMSSAFAHLHHARTRLLGGVRERARVEASIAAAERCVAASGAAYIRSEAMAVRSRLAAIDGALDESLELAASIACEQDEPMRRALALQLVRSGALHDEPRHVHHACALAGDDPLQGDGVDPTMREVVATAAAMADPLAAVDALEQVIEDWNRAGHRLNAAFATLSLGAVLARRGSDAAAEVLERARRELADMGCRFELDVAARLADAASSVGSTAPLAGSPLLAGLRERERAEVLDALGSRRFSDGDLLAGPDVDRTDAALVVREGQVRLVARAADGRRMTLDLLDAGDVVGESVALGMGRDELYAEAVGDVVVGVLPARTLQALTDRMPRLGMNVLEIVRARLRRSNELAEQLAFQPVEQRLARRLLDLADRYGHPTLDGARMVNRAFTQAELAELVHARRETVNGLMKQLREAGTIELRKRRIVVIDQPALRAMAGVDPTA